MTKLLPQLLPRKLKESHVSSIDNGLSSLTGELVSQRNHADTDQLSIVTEDHEDIPPQHHNTNEDNEDSSSQNHNTNNSFESKSPDDSKSETTCRFFLKGKCKHGMRGKDCKFTHPKVCNKFSKHGTRQPRGCNKGQKCKFFSTQKCVSTHYVKVSASLKNANSTM